MFFLLIHSQPSGEAKLYFHRETLVKIIDQYLFIDSFLGVLRRRAP